MELDSLIWYELWQKSDFNSNWYRIVPPNKQIGFENDSLNLPFEKCSKLIIGPKNCDNIQLPYVENIELPAFEFQLQEGKIYLLNPDKTHIVFKKNNSPSILQSDKLVEFLNLSKDYDATGLFIAPYNANTRPEDHLYAFVLASIRK